MRELEIGILHVQYLNLRGGVRRIKLLQIATKKNLTSSPVDRRPFPIQLQPKARSTCLRLTISHFRNFLTNKIIIKFIEILYVIITMVCTF